MEKMRNMIVVWLAILMLVGGMMGFIGVSADVSNNDSVNVKASGATIYVPTDYSTVQQAINAANAGDTVYIYSGTYYENVVINKTINLVGEEKDSTIIDGNYYNDVIYVNVNGVNMSGFSLRYSGSNGGYPDFDSGIDIRSCSDILISDIRILNCGCGIFLDRCSEVWILDSTVVSSDIWGLYIKGSSGITVCHCEVSTNDIGISFWGASNISILNCSVHMNNQTGVGLRDVSNGIITNCSVYSNKAYGVSISESSNNTVKYCDIYSNTLEGLRMSISDYNRVVRCNFFNNSQGINLLCNSANNDISQCIVSENGDGIFLLSNARLNTISKTVICNNSRYGITLQDHSDSNTIINCACYNNHVYCLSFHESSYNTIVYCNITNNTDEGVYIFYDSSSNYNMFHHNNFVDNGLNAYDPLTNYWDDGSEGNYWSDYAGIDANGDGIGDMSYNISGGNGQDRYPLMSPIENAGYLLNIYPLASFTHSSTSPTAEDIIQFIDSSFDLDGYIVSWFWDFDDGNTSTEQNPQHKYSAAGNYTVKLTVTDNNGLNATYTKLITVKEEVIVTDGSVTDGDKEGLLAPEGDERGRFVFTYLVAVSVIVVAEAIIGAIFILRKRKKVKEKEKGVAVEIFRLKLRCPACKETFEIESQKRPFKIKCPDCGKEGVVK